MACKLAGAFQLIIFDVRILAPQLAKEIVDKPDNPQAAGEILMKVDGKRMPFAAVLIWGLRIAVHEAKDRLLWIANGKHAIRPANSIQDVPLQTAGLLEITQHDELEPISVPAGHFGRLITIAPEQVLGLAQ